VGEENKGTSQVRKRKTWEGLEEAIWGLPVPTCQREIGKGEET
jgi:hypothetical protein